MRRRQILKKSAIFATVGLSGLAGCTSPSTEDPTETTETTTSEETTTTAGTDPGQSTSTTVQMVTEGSDYYFDPIGLFVEPGTTVTWRNESGSHSATAYKEGNGPATVTRMPESADAWDSGILTEQGATYQYTFDTTGTYDYFCTPHKTLEMVGRVVVGEPGGPAEGSMPPDGEVPTSQTIVEQESVSYDAFTG